MRGRARRFLQEREFERVGGTRSIRTDARIVAATNRDLSAEVGRGALREDLYYRLNVVSIRLPPLRDREEDIGPLLDHFLRRFALDAGRQRLRFGEAARSMLGAHVWPGNVRELANVVERAVVLTIDDEVGPEVLPEEIVESAAGGPAGATVPRGYHDTVVEAKRAIIREALRQTSGHQTKAAELLGLTQPYLARLIKNLGVRTSS